MDSASTSHLRPLPGVPEEVDHPVRPGRNPVATVGIRLTLAAVTVQTVLHLLNLALSTDIKTIDVNVEHNAFTWLSTVGISAAALACVLLAVSGVGRRAFLLTLAGLIAFLSLDEAVGIHERIGARFVTLLDVSPAWDSILWPVVYLPLLAAVLVLLVVETRRAPRLTSLLVLVGLGCLAAAVGAEVVSSPYSTADGGVAHALEGAVEEALELCGWGLIATGLLSWFAESREFAVKVAPPRLVNRS